LLRPQAASNVPSAQAKSSYTPKFGGGIFGYDIDQNGTEGVLTELQQLSNGNILSAVETFDQKTGKIIKVVSKTETPQNSDLTLGIVGASAALIEHDHTGKNGYVDQRTYRLISPLTSNKYTGQWTPPHFDKNYIIEGVSRIQGTTTTAFLVLDNIFPGYANYIFGSDVTKNTFGPRVKMTDPNFEPYLFPLLGLDTKTNTAVFGRIWEARPMSPILDRSTSPPASSATFKLTSAVLAMWMDSRLIQPMHCLHNDRRRREHRVLRSQEANRILRTTSRRANRCRCGVRSDQQAVSNRSADLWCRAGQQHPGL
jgi:hypothetical protein